MGENKDRSELQSKLEFVINNNPNTILIVDKGLILKEIIVIRDELYNSIKDVAIGKTPFEVFTDEKTKMQCAHFQKSVNRVIEEQIEDEIRYEINYQNKIYHFSALIKPYINNLAIVYTRNINILQGDSDLHELMNTILDRLPLGVFVKDAEDNFNYLYWNRFMEEISGLENENVKGHGDFEIDHDAFISKRERLDLDQDVMQKGKVVEYCGKVKKPSGQYKNIEVTKFPISLRNGKPLLLVLWRDITARLEMEEALKRTQMLTKMALQSSDIRTCSIFINPDSRVGYEDVVMQFNSWSSGSSELQYLSWSQFMERIHPDDLAAYKEAFLKLCRGEIQQVKVEFRIKYPGKMEYCWREASSYVYEWDEKGRPYVLLGCSTNIQERKDQEHDLEEARQKAEVADKMKSKYLADMSHEIRTPLNAITGFSELMAFADTNEERQSYYDIIKTNNQLLMQLINDILDLSKIEADAIKISYAPVDINELMDTTFASVKLRMPKGVELLLEKGLSVCSFGTDSIRLLQLINNLVNNAIKNTKSGRITMGYRSCGEKQLKFYVKDTGVGIPKDKLNNLFNRFVKLNDYVEGIGLGLAICQSLVAKMEGSISVESELGVGSTFSFILPSHD